MNLDECLGAVFTFRHDYVIDDRPPSQDVGRVEISADNGATWAELASYRGGFPEVETQDEESQEWKNVTWNDIEFDALVSRWESTGQPKVG